MTDKRSQTAELLLDLEYNLRRLNLWSSERPSAEALASQQPFCIDTLAFEEWLQFVFIERLRQMIDDELALPDQCGLAPMAEEYFRGARPRPDELIRLLESIDRTLSA